jgi:hypothetical protein
MTTTKENIVEAPKVTKETKKRKAETNEQQVTKKNKNVSTETEEASKPDEKVLEKTEEKPEEIMQTVIDDLITSFKEEQDRIKGHLARLRVLDRSFHKMKTDFGKKFTGLQNSLEKKAKKKADSTPRAKSGFSKPAPLSAELAAFMGLPNDSVVSRTEATKKIIKYVKDHNLEAPENRRQWIPDEKLNKLLKPEKYLKKEGVPLEPLGYFNVQRCLSHHFQTAAAVAAEKV